MCFEEEEWHGLYASDLKYKRFVSQASFSHPAKMSFQLCNKIMTHMEDLGNAVVPQVAQFIARRIKEIA